MWQINDEVQLTETIHGYKHTRYGTVVELPEPSALVGANRVRVFWHSTPRGAERRPKRTWVAANRLTRR